MFIILKPNWTTHVQPDGFWMTLGGYVPLAILKYATGQKPIEMSHAIAPSFVVCMQCVSLISIWEPVWFTVRNDKYQINGYRSLIDPVFFSTQNPFSRVTLFAHAEFWSHPVERCRTVIGKRTKREWLVSRVWKRLSRVVSTNTYVHVYRTRVGKPIPYTGKINVWIFGHSSPRKTIAGGNAVIPHRARKGRRVYVNCTRRHTLYLKRV